MKRTSKRQVVVCNPVQELSPETIMYPVRFTMLRGPAGPDPDYEACVAQRWCDVSWKNCNMYGLRLVLSVVSLESKE
jgi:hypothetical protein